MEKTHPNNDGEERKIHRLVYHKSELQSNFIGNTHMNIKEGFGVLFFIISSIYLIHRLFKYQEMSEHEKLLKDSKREFDEARQEFIERHMNLFPGSYDRTDEIINGDSDDDD